MATLSLDQLITSLEESKRRFGPGAAARTERLLQSLGRRRFRDEAALIRFHEALLFLRAYPAGPAVSRLTEKLLGSFEARVAEIRGDLSGSEDPEVSGIAGTELSAILSYTVVRRLVELDPGEIEVDWDRYDITDRLAGAWRRFLPLFDEDAMVEAHVPYLDWVRAAKDRRETDARWLVRRFESLAATGREREDLWNALELPVRWEFGNSRATRTRMRRPVQRKFFHEAPLIRRIDVSLEAELQRAPLAIERLTREQGRAMLDLALMTSATRFRELHGFTCGDPNHVYRSDAGRGVEIFVCGVPPERRLPVRAYHAALIFKNGVPIGYFETLTVFDRMEVGFNIYYTFREGESAWLLARLLRLFRQLLAVNCFSIDPYQIGHENQEAIDAGAFWFYRKLGFRPVRPELRGLLEPEEEKIRRDPAYRTPARVLRKLAAGHMVYEIPGTPRGDWDRFEVRNVGLAVARRVAEKFGGDAARMQRAAVAGLASVLGVEPVASPAFEDFAMALALAPDLARWSEVDKRALAEVIRAKGAAEEYGYVRRMQRHPKLRRALQHLGETS